MQNLLNKKEAIKYLEIPEKNFENYFRFSKEIKGFKKNGRWHFTKADLTAWRNLKKERMVTLTMKEYEECFEFAIKMAYAGRGHHGTGIRGARSETQTADDFILGILAEYGVKKFLKEKFNTEIKLDTSVHPDHITPQDFEMVKSRGVWRKPSKNIAVKSSKIKSCFLVVDPLEYEDERRKSDLYIFVRVDLPSDHLFRILREHSFFKKVKNFLEKDERFRKIEKIGSINAWICGYTEHKNLHRVTEIPGQPFKGYRYVKSVAELKNTNKDWKEFIKII